MKQAINTIFESKNYPTIMFLAIILTSIILLFNFINFVEEINNQITGYAISEQEEQNTTSEIQEKAKPLIGEVYTTFAWGIFYIIIIIIVIIFTILSIILKNTIKINLIEEDKTRGFLT